jgi:thiol-disulfide isomerase/thioredoxin
VGVDGWTSRWTRAGGRAAWGLLLGLTLLLVAVPGRASTATDGAEVTAGNAAEALELTAGAAVAPDAAGTTARTVADGGPVVVHYFYGDGCPHCARQALELDAWEQRFDVEIHRYEVWEDAANRALFQELAAAYGADASGVPTTFIGERVWIGFDEASAEQMRAVIATCEVQGCPDPVSVLDPAASPEVDEGGSSPTPEGPPGPDETPGSGEVNGSAGGVDADGAAAEERTVLSIPLLGTVDTEAMGLLPATGLIAFVDGFNPCSLWVLSVLLAMLLRTGSRRRIAIVGGAFLVTTAAVYGLFIAGVFGAMSYVGYLTGIRWAVALLALTFAVVNIKDYFAFKQGFSFTIPDRFKPRIYRGGRGLLDPERPLPAVAGAAVLMALGIALVELPCTAGFPVVWSGLLTDAGVGGAEFGGLLSVYLLIYLLDELVLFAAVVVTLRVTRFQEHHGQVLKLVGGMVMLALGVVLLVRPAIMNGLVGTLGVFFVAAALTAVVHLATRRLRGPGLGSRLRST